MQKVNTRGENVLNYRLVGICIFSMLIVILAFMAVKSKGMLLLKMFVNCIIGVVVLLIINWCGQYMGFRIPFNALNSVIIGFLGVPGIALIVAFRYIL